jgi:hypothetical protein
VGPQLGLGTDQPGATDDQSPVAEGGLGDLYSSFGPEALRATRQMSSSTNLSAPRDVFADPLGLTVAS